MVGNRKALQCLKCTRKHPRRLCFIVSSRRLTLFSSCSCSCSLCVNNCPPPPARYYPHDIGIFGPSVFFNNYGIRSFHEKAGLVSWNWCAPYYLGCNSICVNGKNSIALASLVLGQEILDMIRDQMWIEMKRIMKSNKKIN